MAKIIYTVISEKEAGKSTKEFEIEIPTEEFEKFRKLALHKAVQNAEISGFRKGKAPEAIVLKTVGEMAILQEAADEAIHEAIIGVLSEKQIRFIGQPHATLTKLAPHNPLQFKITVALVPELTLPEYKKIAAKENEKPLPESAVTDEELKTSLDHIKKILAGQTGESPKETVVVPELTDETVKKLGNFKAVAEFTEKLRADLLSDKQTRNREKRVLEIIENIVSNTKGDIPEALVEHELDRIESEFMHDIERIGMKPEEYLKKINKTKEVLRKEWFGNAEKRAKFELVLPRIAAAEKITVPAEDIERETTHLLEHYKDADKETAKLYIERTLLRQHVLKFLENQK